MSYHVSRCCDNDGSRPCSMTGRAEDGPLHFHFRNYRRSRGLESSSIILVIHYELG